MTATSPSTSTRGPVAPTSAARVALRPLGIGDVRIGGFWADRQRANASAIPIGRQRLEEAGNLRNLRIAAGQAEGEAIGPVFADSDVYKWLEALAWEQAREPSGRLAGWQDLTTRLVAAAQEPGGYLNSYVQLTRSPADRYRDLEGGHELYCAGHLLQAAVAQHRATAQAELLEVAIRFADHLVTVFGPGRRDGVDGHPEVETALVELYRETGRRGYLDLAAYFVGARGRGLLTPPGHRGPAYFSDRVPVREATSVEGHAVRALYLAAGATDVATEAGDDELLAALVRSWESMVSSKMYLTGGVGSRWYGEAFGDPYELPPDTAYCETCAAIASVQWSWRLLLATGEARYADLIERTLYNAVLPGVSLDGERFFYVNTLRVRATALADDQRSALGGRQPWYGTACCPPNVMRTLSSLDHYLASTDADGIQLHQYAPASIRAEAGGPVELRVATDYPWQGRIEIEVVRSPGLPWTLSLRIPAWGDGFRLTVNDEVDEAPVRPPAYQRLRRTWRAGDRIVLELPVRPRYTIPDDRVESVRGCVAIERGPLVYCFEHVDQPDPVVLDDVVLERAELVDEDRPDLLGGVTTVRTTARPVRRPAPSGIPSTQAPVEPEQGEFVTLTAVPYYAWANRGPGAMTVWADARG